MILYFQKYHTISKYFNLNDKTKRNILFVPSVFTKQFLSLLSSWQIPLFTDELKLFSLAGVEEKKTKWKSNRSWMPYLHNENYHNTLCIVHFPKLHVLYCFPLYGKCFPLYAPWLQTLELPLSLIKSWFPERQFYGWKRVSLMPTDFRP